MVVKMTVTTNIENEKMTVAVEGRLDTSTAPELEAALIDIPTEVNELDLNLEKTEYVSSAGLRVILSLHKRMAKSAGSLYISNVNDSVKEVFDVTGFSDILDIR